MVGFAGVCRRQGLGFRETAEASLNEGIILFGTVRSLDSSIGIIDEPGLPQSNKGVGILLGENPTGTIGWKFSIHNFDSIIDSNTKMRRFIASK